MKQEKEHLNSVVKFLNSFQFQSLAFDKLIQFSFARHISISTSKENYSKKSYIQTTTAPNKYYICFSYLPFFILED